MKYSAFHGDLSLNKQDSQIEAPHQPQSLSEAGLRTGQVQKLSKVSSHGTSRKVLSRDIVLLHQTCGKFSLWTALQMC